MASVEQDLAAPAATGCNSMIVAMAGHVDHGKSALARHLTGVEPDRLIEEKARGLTIDLGFSYLPLTSGAVLGIVDVPGHQRFVANMLAGVSAIDFAILVVAADDGPMPQTQEHLAILDQLGIPAGVIVITKIDRVTEERLAEVEASVKRLTAGTFLEGSPVFRISNSTGAGVDDLRHCLFDRAGDLSGRCRRGNFRMATDRRFNIKGAGLVVTGAAFSGEIAVGDHVLVGPKGIPARVRALHAQNRSTPRAGAGDRIALNLTGSDIDKSTVVRGDWVVAPAAHHPTDRIDVSLEVLQSEKRALQHDSLVHLHIGAFDVLARVAILDGRRIAPGETGLAQLKLDSQTIVSHGDRFVLRDSAGQSTIAGGMVLDPFAPARRRARPERIAVLEALRHETDLPSLLQKLILEAESGVDLAWFERTMNIAPSEARSIFGKVEYAPYVVTGRSFGLSQWRWGELCAKILGFAGHSNSVAFSIKELQRSLPGGVSRHLLASACSALVEQGQLQSDGQTYSKIGTTNPEDEKRDALAGKLLSALRESGVPPDNVNVIARNTGTNVKLVVSLFNRAAANGVLRRVTEARFFMPDTLLKLAQDAEAVGAASEDGWFRVTDFRDKTGIGRNPCIEVLEYFDKVGFTRRIGDDRQIARAAAELFGRL